MAVPGSSSSQNPAYPAVGWASPTEGNLSSSGTSSPLPKSEKKKKISVYRTSGGGSGRGGERDVPGAVRKGSSLLGVVGFSSIRGGTRDGAVPSCTLGVLCTPGASEGFCFVSLVAASLGLAPRCPCVCLSGASCASPSQGDPSPPVLVPNPVLTFRGTQPWCDSNSFAASLVLPSFPVLTPKAPF